MPFKVINPLNPRLYLASRSPRRRELLTQIGVQFDTLLFRDLPRQDPEVDETPLPGEAPLVYVERVARAKAIQGERIVELRKLPQRLILAADKERLDQRPDKSGHFICPSSTQARATFRPK